MLHLHPSQAEIDNTLAAALLICGCPSLVRRVAPSRRLLEASLSVCPWHAEEPYHDPITRQDDLRHAVAAACSQDPESLCRRRRRAGQVLRLFPRSTQPEPDSLIPPPFTHRTPPGMEFLQPGGLWA